MSKSLLLLGELEGRLQASSPPPLLLVSTTQWREVRCIPFVVEPRCASASLCLGPLPNAYAASSATAFSGLSLFQGLIARPQAPPAPARRCRRCLVCEPEGCDHLSGALANWS